jgi:chorismate dehydratase
LQTRLRVGAVPYLNARPLVFGLEQGLGARRIELSYAAPSVLADRLAAHDLDVALLPTIELARIANLTVVPGLAIGSRGAAASVLLLSRVPPREARSVALDPESRTSNALVQVLYESSWRARPEFRVGSPHLEEAIAANDAVVRIGDKALFGAVPPGFHVVDLGEAWMQETGLPFVFAVWAAWPGVVDRELYEILHASRRSGSKVLDAIADDYTWNGAQYPEIARRYLREHMHYRLGAAEMRSLRSFLRAAGRLGIVPEVPAPLLARFTLTSCDVAADRPLPAKIEG